MRAVGLVPVCRDTLAERGVKPENIRFELFLSGQPGQPDAPLLNFQ